MKQKIKYSIIFLIIFLTGILFERFDLDKKIITISKSLVNSTSKVLFSFSNKERIFIKIKPDNFQKIEKNRESALNLGILNESMQKWVPAKLEKDNINYNVRIRLKGAFSDHWKDDSKWSYKISVNNDSKPIFNLKRFNLQPPNTMSYLYEWLFMKSLEKEKLISLKVNFMNVNINDSNEGAYILQEAITNRTIENNGRKVGPVIGFSKDLYLTEFVNANKLLKQGAIDSLNGLEDTFWRAKIEPVQFSQETDQKQLDYLKKSIYLLESFRSGTLKPREVFDIKQLSKVMALRAILGSSEFDYRDIKFYFNPETSLLEPISKESHVRLDLNFKESYFSWWIDSSKIRPHYTNNTNFFLDLLYKDLEFYKLYLSELKNYSEGDYFKDLIQENKKEFNKFRKILKQNYPTTEIISEEHLKITKLRVQDFLNPVQGINSYFSNYENNYLSLTISNLQRLPVEILGIELEDESFVSLNKPLVLKGKRPLMPVKNVKIKFNCEFKEACKQKYIDKQKIIFKILGQDENKSAKISKYYQN